MNCIMINGKIRRTSMSFDRKVNLILLNFSTYDYIYDRLTSVHIIQYYIEYNKVHLMIDGHRCPSNLSDDHEFPCTKITLHILL